MKKGSDYSLRNIRLDDDQRLAWLRLIRSENVGPATFRDLINHFGSAQRALEALPELSKRGGKRAIRIASLEAAAAEMEAARRMGVNFIAVGEANYPTALRHSDAPPPLLAVRGDISILSQPMVGIVGARNASVAGATIASRLASELGHAGLIIVSGLARGIDLAAHKASVTTGTIAVLAGGHDKIYPPENKDFLERMIASKGVAVSEMPFGWQPRARDFPRRNRIVAGMALGVIVVEAARRSGALITANMATEMGRLVFAIPGSPLDSRSEGCNNLLKEGAILATTADDILNLILPLIDKDVPQDHVNEYDDEVEIIKEIDISDDVRYSIVASLGTAPTSIDDIIRHTGHNAATIRLILVELDLAGRLERHPNGSISL